MAGKGVKVFGPSGHVSDFVTAPLLNWADAASKAAMRRLQEAVRSSSPQPLAEGELLVLHHTPGEGFCPALDSALKVELLGASTDSISGERVVWAHAAGLPAAFPIHQEELANVDGMTCSRWHELPSRQQSEIEDVHDVTAMSLMKGLHKAMPSGDGEWFSGQVLRQYLLSHYADVQMLEGLTGLISHNQQLVQQLELECDDAGAARGNRRRGYGRGRSDLLQYDFPFYCGVGDHAEKLLLDTRKEVTTMYGPLCTHGNKVLFPGGVAVCLGVANMTLPGCDSFSSSDPQLFWHPLGANGCAVVPQLHLPRSFPFVSAETADAKSQPAAVRLGSCTPTLNGPCEQLRTSEPLSRYLQTSGDTLRDGRAACDTTDWLCDGLFGLTAGSAVPRRPGYQVVGVAMDPAEDGNALTMFCQKDGGKKLVSLPEVVMRTV